MHFKTGGKSAKKCSSANRVAKVKSVQLRKVHGAKDF